jgi:hypothetical protein
MAFPPFRIDTQPRLLQNNIPRRVTASAQSEKNGRAADGRHAPNIAKTAKNTLHHQCFIVKDVKIKK